MSAGLSLRSPLSARIEEVFAADGVLSHGAAPYTPRQGQIDMATAIGETVDAGGVLVVEAGTGVGKTFAYLVPALLSGERVLLSTATKTLQDQLFGRDLPELLRALRLPLRTALLKGRASYLCLHRLERARWDVDLGDRAALLGLASIEQWARATHGGDLAELPDLDERSPLIPLVTSTRDNCLGSQCPQYQKCHVNLARREALAADVVVVNHHLVFADLAVRESGVAELLPTVRIAIFDEAHQLNETGVQFLGLHLSTGQLLDFARDTLATGLQQARGLVDWQQLVADVEHAARELRLLAGQRGAASRINWTDAAPEGLSGAEWQQTLHAVLDALRAAAEGLDSVSELGPDFVRLHERALTWMQRTERFMAVPDEGAVRWLDTGGTQLRLMESPLDIAEAMQTRVLGTGEAAAAKSWIFTSATLGDDEALTWFTSACGLGGARTLRVESPFDYANQAALYVPEHIAKPADPAHSAQVAEFAAQAVQRLRGRTLVLTTTLRALRAIGDALKTHFEASGGIEVLVQGQWPKRRLMERFRQGDADGQPGCVLVASASFWEGVDVPGDALQLVVIDKLPFPPPNDPLVEARAQRAEREGKKPFMDYFVPEAAVALKQGAGRLIRRESDQGVLVVCDTRLTKMGYGRRLRAALPPMRLLKTEAEFQQLLDTLRGPGLEPLVTRPSTTASLWP